ALHRRARALSAGTPAPQGDSLAGVDIGAALPGEPAEQVGLVEALDEPGDPAAYSAVGLRRIRQFAAELAQLRRRLDQPLPELVAEAERMLLLNIETLACAGPARRAHLDAFADVVAEYAATTLAADLAALVAYLAVAEQYEDGLDAAEVVQSPDRVQVLTVHSAKGLEWQIVAVPHLVEGLFPGRKKSSSWLTSPTALPVVLRGDAQDLPSLRLDSGADQQELTEALAEHEDAFEQRRLIEERRLAYVALTRSAGCLLVCGHRWSEGSATPRDPAEYLQEIGELLTADPSLGRIAHWAPAPEAGADNPLTRTQRSARWPADPLGSRRPATAQGAAMVLDALAELEHPDEEPAPAPELEPAGCATAGEHTGGDDPMDWARDVDVLLAERAAVAAGPAEVSLPSGISVSQLVELGRDPDALAMRLRRPLPFPPNAAARRGTAFHSWVERRFGATALLDVDELPGAADAEVSVGDEADLADLQARFLAGEWGNRTPIEVEVPFETQLDGYAVRGRIDAVFAEPDGGVTVVDWKTGSMPSAADSRPLAVQLAAYRVAYAALAGLPLERVRAAFYYVRADRTVRLDDLPDAADLQAMLRNLPEPADHR
ncbi:MAG: 3'-5' exonuclease, partial [Sciscionella sp.]